MHRSGNDFSYVHNLKRGKHAFKFIVDDEWRFAPDQPTVADIEGRINNFIDVSDFAPYRKYNYTQLLMLSSTFNDSFLSLKCLKIEKNFSSVVLNFIYYLPFTFFQSEMTVSS